MAHGMESQVLNLASRPLPSVWPAAQTASALSALPLHSPLRTQHWPAGAPGGQVRPAAEPLWFCLPASWEAGLPEGGMTLPGVSGWRSSRLPLVPQAQHSPAERGVSLLRHLEFLAAALNKRKKQARQF